MNKLKLYFVGALFAMAEGMTAQTMTFGDVDLQAGGTDTLKISMVNPQPISAWQMRLYLPKGLTIAKNTTNGDWMFSVSSRHSKDFVYGISPSAKEPLPKDGCYTIICFPRNNAFISSGEGDLCVITFQADATYSDKDDVVVKNIHLSDRSAKNIALGDVTITNELTGIRQIENNEKVAVMYSLSGQRVSGTPHKGIYIRGGKKILIK
jgi:hypothetical protein